MSGPFDAAIEIIRRFNRKSFGYTEKETAQLEAAIRVLEAAGKVDKGRAFIAITWIPEDRMPKGLRDILAALPDKERDK